MEVEGTCIGYVSVSVVEAEVLLYRSMQVGDSRNSGYRLSRQGQSLRSDGESWNCRWGRQWR
jgi:hypothetical protein